MENQESSAITFVTKQVLVSFYPEVCVMMDGNAIFARALFCECEVEEGKELRHFDKASYMVLGSANGPRFNKPVRLHVNYGHIVSVSEV